jgi:hypothetical protein
MTSLNKAFGVEIRPECSFLGIFRHLYIEEIMLLRSRDMGRSVAVRRWTPTAVDCYKRGCNCDGCFYTDFFKGTSQKCQMKASVLELVRVLGTPDVELQQVLID